MLDTLIRAYNEAVFETDKEAAFAVVEGALAHGVKPEQIVFDVVIPAIEEMMATITRDPDANLALHFMTAQIASEVTERMLARFEAPPASVGCVVLGTAAGDLHSLGKRIVGGCLRSMMVEVVDLGINVPAERFVDEAVARGAQVIGVSAMMVHTATGDDGSRRVRRLLRERGLEDRIRLVVGGAPYRFDDQLYREAGADAYARDGVAAARLIVELIHDVRGTTGLATVAPATAPAHALAATASGDGGGETPAAPTRAHAPAASAVADPPRWTGDDGATPLEILVAAVSGTPAPRIPVFCNVIDQGATELGMTLAEYYSRGEHVAEAQLRMLKRYGHDNVWGLFYVGREAELLGCRGVLFAEDGPPNVEHFVIQSHADIERFEIPADITLHPAFEEPLACMRILRAEVGATHPICAYLTASLTLPALLMGMERWMQLLLHGPAPLRDRLLGLCSDFFRQEVAAYRAAGANVLVYSNPFGSTDFIGYRRFRELALPWIRRDLEPGGLDGIVYYCGMAPFNSVIPPLLDEVGIGAYYISPQADLAEAKGFIGGRGLTCGVIDDIQMIRWTPEQTAAEVRRLCRAGAEGGHFLLGTGVMPRAVPEANIRAFIEAGKAHGRTP